MDDIHLAATTAAPDQDDVNGLGLWVAPAMAGAAVVGTAVGVTAAGTALAVAYGAGYVAGALSEDKPPKVAPGT